MVLNSGIAIALIFKAAVKFTVSCRCRNARHYDPKQ